jgi:RNA polymerase sigma factor (sigma-70 family)
MGMDSDQSLVTATLAGDPGAFARLVVRHRRTVESVLGRMLPYDEVEDVLQETFLRAYLSISRLRDAERFPGWLCGIGVNLAKMRLRQRAVRPSIAVGEISGTVDLEERELLHTVQQAVALLPPGQRDVVLMHYVDDLSCDEIARLLGTTAGAVRVRLHRARAQLRRELAPLAPVPLTAPTKEVALTEMTVEDVLVRVSEDDPFKPATDQRIVVLREREGDRFVPIWMGAAEGDALAYRLTGGSPVRPLTSDLMVELLRATGGTIVQVAITALREEVFYGSVAVRVDGRVEELDARPSDAMNLAVRVGAPILVDEAVLEQSGVSRQDVGDRVEEKAGPGTWTSVSAELLRELHRLPGK